MHKVNTHAVFAEWLTKEPKQAVLQRIHRYRYTYLKAVIARGIHKPDDQGSAWLDASYNYFKLHKGIK